jgi:hypothetical protein
VITPELSVIDETEREAPETKEFTQTTMSLQVPEVVTEPTFIVVPHDVQVPACAVPSIAGAELIVNDCDVVVSGVPPADVVSPSHLPPGQLPTVEFPR